VTGALQAGLADDVFVVHPLPGIHDNTLAFGAGYQLIILLAVGMGLIQYFFSDKLVLWSTRARVIEKDEYPELQEWSEAL